MVLTSGQVILNPLKWVGKTVQQPDLSGLEFTSRWF